MHKPQQNKGYKVMAKDLAKVGPKGIKQVFSKYMSLKGKVERLNEKAEEVVEGVVRTTETVGSSFLFGGVQGANWDRKDSAGNPTHGLQFWGIPLDLGSGVALHTMAVLGIGGKYSGHLRNFADGALCAYVSNLGRGVGYRWAQDRAKSPSSVKGNLRDDIAAMLSS
jgi:hypothetical protein